MAISFVGSYASTHAATSAQTINFSNLRDAAGGTPTVLEDDIVFVAVENASTLNRSTGGGADVLVPGGYTGVLAHDYRDDSNDSNFRVSYKVMGASPDASVAIPASNATTAGVGYVIFVFRGVDTTTPLDVAAQQTGAINTGKANPPSIAPSTAGAWIFVAGGAAVAAGAVFTNAGDLSATTNHFRSATITTTTNDANIGAGIKINWTSGAFDPAIFGGSTTTNTGSWSAASIALREYIAPVTHDGAASLSGTGTTAAVGKRQQPGASVLSGAGALVAAGLILKFAAASLSGVGAMAAAGMVSQGGSAALSGAGSFNAFGSVARAGQAALSGTGSLTATGNATLAASAIHTGAGTLAAAGLVARPGSVALSGAGGLTAAASITGQGSAAFAGVGTFAASGEITGAPVLDGAASLAGAGTLTAAGTRNLPAVVSLSGFGAGEFVGRLVIHGAVTFTGQGILTASVPISVSVPPARIATPEPVDRTARTLPRMAGVDVAFDGRVVSPPRRVVGVSVVFDGRTVSPPRRIA